MKINWKEYLNWKKVVANVLFWAFWLIIIEFIGASAFRLVGCSVKTAYSCGGISLFVAITLFGMFLWLIEWIGENR